MARVSSSERGNSPRLAYLQLREMIVSGKLLPGTWLIEADLAEHLGFSRTPVRSALHQLQQERYVIASGNGAKSRLMVAPLTKEDARELYSIIGHLEGLAAGAISQLSSKARDSLTHKLRDYNEGLVELREKNRLRASRVFDLDIGFHRAIVEACAGPRLSELHQVVQPQAERYWRLYAAAILDDLGKSIKEHEAIIKAISEADADAAEIGLQTNWVNGARRLAKVIDAMGERGNWLSQRPTAAAGV